jgi:hypothetical protein
VRTRTLAPFFFVAGSVPFWFLLHAYHQSFVWRWVAGTAIWTLAFNYGEWRHHHDHCDGRRHL